MPDRTIIDEVKDQYAAVARSKLSNDSSGVRALSTTFGYSTEDLNALPEQANMGLSCGNPLALANLAPGEVVLDLGCGGGMDTFLAAHKVGPHGRVIGVDMTADMLDRARSGMQKLGLTNVEFLESTIDHLPLPNNSVNCIISNCVINLVPDKLAVFREAFRVLAPGGRIELSDIALLQPLPSQVRASVEAYVGCISGAVLIEEYRDLLEKAGFASVEVTNTNADLNIYASVTNGSCCAGSCQSTDDNPANSTLHDSLAKIMQKFNVNDFAASVRVRAIKKSDSPLPNTSIPSSSLTPPIKDNSMSELHVFDKPMCCSTGVCGPQVDPVLPQFAADLEWLKEQGHHVERFNLAHHPTKFIENPTIHQLISSEGTDCLPVIIVNGRVVSQKAYPSRATLSQWVEGKSTKSSLPVATASSGCCGSKGCGPSSGCS